MFSPQGGTAAAKMDEQVPERVKRRRYRELMEAAREGSLLRNREQVGREMTVLVESRPARAGDEQGVFVGRSYRDAPEVDGLVICKGTARPGEMKRVRVTGAMAYDLLAEPLDTPARPD